MAAISKIFSGLLESRRGEKTTFQDDFVEIRYFLTELGGYHADEPVLAPSWQFSNDERRAEFPQLQVSLRKLKENNLTFRNHENDELVK